MLSLISLSLFRTSINTYYFVQNEMIAKQSFYRAQSVAGQMANSLRALDLNDLTANDNVSRSFTWLLDDKSINLKSVGKPSYWKQLTPKKFPPDAQAIAVLLNTRTSSQMPAESVIMTHDRHIQTFYFSILAMAEVSGSTSIVEMGFRKQFVK
jgi:hypothetical protein